MATEIASEETLEVAQRQEKREGRRRAYRRLRVLRELRVGAVGGAVVLFLIIMALAAPLVAPYDAYSGEIVERLQPPFWEAGGSAAHWLGTDGVGRDVLSRLIYAAQVSLFVGAASTLVATVVGVLLGLAAGYLGKNTDMAISTLVNIMLTFPFVLLALAVISVLGSSMVNLIIVLGISGWPVYTRVVRAEVMRIKEMDYILAAKSLGFTGWRIAFRHILPNLLNAIIVLGSIQVARMIVSEAFLGFLGLGVKPPTPTWGNMLGEYRAFMYDRWWLPTFPGLMIFVTTLSINLFGDALRDYLDPRSRDY